MEYKKYLYAAYGSNLNLEQMRRRCPTAELVGTSVISNSTLLFKARQKSSYVHTGVLDIVPCKGASTPVALFKITQTDENHLDIYEGFPDMYVKKMKFVELNGVRQRVMFYIMNDKVRFLPCLPSVRYYHTVIQGYVDNNFDVSNICKCFCDTAKLAPYAVL